MRIAALILGIFGALAGFVGSLITIFTASVGGAFGLPDAEIVTVVSVIALIMSIVGLIGATLSIAKPRIAASLMLVSAIVGLICIFVAYMLASLLLLLAALFAFLGRGRRASAS